VTTEKFHNEKNHEGSRQDEERRESDGLLPHLTTTDERLDH